MKDFSEFLEIEDNSVINKTTADALVHKNIATRELYSFTFFKRLYYRYGAPDQRVVQL